MTRFTRSITTKVKEPIQAVILAAGASARTRSYEPRCLLKYNGKSLLDHQLDAINKNISKVDICIVTGVENSKLLKKIDRKIRTIENVKHEDTNSGESMRVAFNSSPYKHFLFIHGDLVLDEEIFKKVSFDESFVFIDSNDQIDKKEIGVMVVDDTLSAFCYSSPAKWCQIVYMAKKETEILERMLWRDGFDTTHLLSHEIIGSIIENGGTFKCVELKNKFIKEIDSLKDLSNENTGRK